MALLRMLVVEDDPLLRRFVRLALETLPMEVLECDSVAAAIQILASAPVNLILTDLMLQGASGVDLLVHLQAFPGLRGQAKVVVLSGGLTPATRLALAPLQVWCMLEKPVSIGVLEQCVQAALADVMLPAATPTPQPATAVLPAIDPYFGGDAALFHLYRASCLAQFPHDISAGDQASAAQDAQALRRVAHNLKSVLLIIHLPELSAQARTLEQACLAVPPDAAAGHWKSLRSALAALTTDQAFAHI